MNYVNARTVASNIAALYFSGDDKQMPRILRQIKVSMGEINLHTDFTVMTQIFTLGADHSIKMPTECVRVLKCGVKDENGRIRMMGVDNLLRKENCECTEDTPDPACSFCAFHNFGVGSTLYGYRHDNFPNGRYRYDQKTNRISFGSGYDIFDGASIFVEYATSLTPDSYLLIPEQFEQALIYKVAHSLLISTNPGVAQMMMAEFRRSWEMLKRLEVPAIHDVIAAFQGNYMSAPKT